MAEARPRVWLLIPAGGSSQRMGQSLAGASKVLSPLGGTSEPLLSMVLRGMFESGCFEAAVIAVRDEDRSAAESLVAALQLGSKTSFVPAGPTRQASVYNALREVPSSASLVAVHDAARPFCSAAQLSKTIAAASKSGAALLALPARATLKRVHNGRVVETLDRTDIWEAQTPQVFDRALLLRAHEQSIREKFEATDDCQLVERLGQVVEVIEGSSTNIKVTTPDDILFVHWLAAEKVR